MPAPVAGAGSCATVQTGGRSSHILVERDRPRMRRGCEGEGVLHRRVPANFHCTMSDYDLVEARFTISAMQTDLDRATAQVNELQATIGALNERLAIGDEQIENLTLDLSLERLRGEIADAAETKY